ncbi:normal mucosa of esophagus-specific gene 1 protein-like [Notamacropus eugenii]|uniref:normal mucosa of esophagus-specific gene 1 protein-like n=1 Tax=Notamacropus eugenii TaxID=9315 RepID=UPI003B685415
MNFFQLMKKKKELIPLIVFVSIAGGGGVLMSLYSLGKSDVIVNRHRNPEPWENVNPSQPQKLFSINQKWEPVEELETVKQLTK